MRSVIVVRTARKTGYHNEYSNPAEDDIIRNSRDIEKST